MGVFGRDFWIDLVTFCEPVTWRLLELVTSFCGFFSTRGFSLRTTDGVSMMKRGSEGSSALASSRGFMACEAGLSAARSRFFSSPLRRISSRGFSPATFFTGQCGVSDGISGAVRLNGTSSSLTFISRVVLITESSPFDGAAFRPLMTGVFPLLNYIINLGDISRRTSGS